MTDYDSFEFIDFEVPASNVKFDGKTGEAADMATIHIGDFRFDRLSYMLTKTDHDTYTFRLAKQNMLGEPYLINMQRQVTVPGTGKKELADVPTTTMQLYEYIESLKSAEKEEKPEFVTIKVSKKRFYREPWGTDNMKEPYQEIWAPEGYRYSRPVSQLREIEGEPDYKEFSLPADYPVRLKKSVKQEDGTYVDEILSMEAKDLYNFYKVEQNKFNYQKAKASEFVELIVSKKQVVGEPYVGNDGEERRYVLLYDGYKISRKSGGKNNQLHEIEDDPYHYKIYLPKKYTDGSEAYYFLTKSVKLEDETYKNETLQATAEEIKENFEAYKQEFKRRAKSR